MVLGNNSNIQSTSNGDQSDEDQSDDSRDFLVTQSPGNDSSGSEDESNQDGTLTEEIQQSSEPVSKVANDCTVSPSIPLRRRAERTIHTPQTARVIHAQKAIAIRPANKRAVRPPEKYTPEQKKRKH